MFKRGRKIGVWRILVLKEAIGGIVGDYSWNWSYRGQGVLSADGSQSEVFIQGVTLEDPHR